MIVGIVGKSASDANQKVGNDEPRHAASTGGEAILNPVRKEHVLHAFMIFHGKGASIRADGNDLSSRIADSHSFTEEASYCESEPKAEYLEEERERMGRDWTVGVLRGARAKSLAFPEGAAEAVPKGREIGIVNGGALDCLFVYAHGVLEPFFAFFQLGKLGAVAGEIVGNGPELREFVRDGKQQVVRFLSALQFVQGEREGKPTFRLIR
jgi:hypothetical protein